ncbi:oocyte zinc finger protein XlCOF6-like isoform X5 [Maniola hyperantus]|uniref:oocyte zinc finger protein XlCOF6-like isoform X5 n=1 Tax=Aphantopus hyperantus TaxID=2795564 RepID=UPI0015689F47|nr:oocyte zinc finger protein XlCOF6-like isoform X4 [Maniola hyperantus]
MEGVLSDGMCRCCATEGSFKDFQVAYQWMGVEEIYGNMLKDCFDITLSVSEEISNGGICEVCITQLRNACNFKQQVQRTEEKFQKKLQEASFKTEGIKMEISRFEDDDSNISADDFSSPEYEVPIKVEKVEEKPKKRAAAKASTSKAKKTKASEGEPSVKRVDHQLIIKSEITEDVKKTIKVEKTDKSEGNKQLTVKINKNRPATEIVTAIAKMPNVTVRKLTVKRPAPILNKTTIIKLPHNHTLVKGLPKPKIYRDNDPVMEKNKHFANFEAVLAHSTATPIRSHDGFTYTCCFCADQYKNPVDLKSHTLMTHNNGEDRREFMRKQTSGNYLLKLDITLLKCNICDESIDTLEGLLDHLQNNHKKLIHTDVKNQIIPFKFGDEEMKCVVCSLAFSKFKVLLNHMHTHYRNYVCEICDYGCINRRAMKSHEHSHKTGSFECSECNKVFQTRDRMRSHMKAVHKYKNMPNKCGVCNERFRSNKLKDQHLVTVHGMSPVIRKCSACDQTFTSQNLLRLHTKRFHLMERRFKCTECEMTFFAKNQLQYHMLKHTGRKDFQCDVCMKWFTRKSVLKEHMRIHMNDRRFTCLQCGRGFVQKCSWRSHMRTVHGEIDDKAMSMT